MNQASKTKRKRAMAALAVFALALTFSNHTVYAHGGEDHSQDKAPVVSTSANMVVRTARVGDLEVTLKHRPVEPDKEFAARVFLTRYETNAPVEGAKVFVVIAGGSGSPVEATAAPGNAPGIYEAKLPPTPQGDYTLAMRFETGGATQTVEYGLLRVAQLPPPATTNESTWARTALIALGALIGLGFLGLIIHRATVTARRNRGNEEAATA